MFQFELDINQVNTIISALNFQANFTLDLVQKIQSTATQQAILQQQAQAAKETSDKNAQTIGEENANQKTPRIQESPKQNSSETGKKGEPKKKAEKSAGSIAAKAARSSSVAAKKKNPALKKVIGKTKK